MRRHAVFALLLLPGLALLAGCGQKGPLTLPPRPAAPAPASTVQGPAPASTAPLSAPTRSG